MERLVYSVESLSRSLRQLESHFGLSSEEFYERHTADQELPIPRFERHVWASLYEDVVRLSDAGAVG